MSDTTLALSYPTVRLAGIAPLIRTIGIGLAYLGGGFLFAATVYVAVALPGLFD